MENESEKVKYPQSEKPSLLKRIFAWLAKGAEESAKRRAECSS